MPRHAYRAVLAAVLLLAVVPAAATAHSELVSATPGADDEVVAPTELVARFSQDLDPSRTSLEVRDDAGETVARGGELGEGPREFRLALPELEPGVYHVRYTSFSREDGELHRDPDAFSFTVVAAASPTPSPTPTPSRSPSAAPSLPPSPTPPPSPSATPTPTDSPGGGSAAGDQGGAVIPILAALALVAGLGVWLTRRRVT